MKLMLTIVGKDFRRLKWGVLLLFAVTLAKFALGWWLMLGARLELEAWKELPSLVAALVAAETLLTWLLTGLIVLEDPLVGTEAGWRTRPIAGVRLLAAKIGGAMVMLASPVVILGVPWWWFNGFGPGDMAVAAVLGLASQLAVIVPSMLVASLVDTVARYVVWSLVGVAGLLTFPLVWGVVLAKRLPNSGDAFSMLSVATVLAAMAGVLVRQFRCGLSRKMWVAGGVIWVVIVAVIGGGLVAGLRRAERREWTENNAELAPDLRLSWRRAAVYDVPNGRPPHARVQSTVVIEGVPPGSTADLVQMRHEWTWPDGMQVKQMDWGSVGFGLRAEQFGLRPAAPDPETEQWMEERRRREWLKYRMPWDGGMTTKPEAGLVARRSVQVPRSVGARLKSSTPSYFLRGDLRVVKAVGKLELPLVVDAQQAALGSRVRVTALTHYDNQTVLRLVVAHSAWPDFTINELKGWMLGLRPPAFYAIDRDKGRLSHLSNDRSADLFLSGVALNMLVLRMDAPQFIRNGKWTVIDPTWRERTKLLLIGWDEVARVTREVRVEVFTVSAEPGREP